MLTIRGDVVIWYWEGVRKDSYLYAMVSTITLDGLYVCNRS